VLEAIKAAQQETGAALVLITHDLGVIAGMAERVMVMYAGRAVEVGGIDDVFYRPRMPYTVGLLNSLPRLDVTEKERLTPIHGTPPSLQALPPGCPFGPRCPMHVAQCNAAEPELRTVDGTIPHTAACIRAEELIGQDRYEAGKVFEATSIDAGLVGELAAAALEVNTEEEPVEELPEPPVMGSASGLGSPPIPHPEPPDDPAAPGHGATP
jgi:peptide/nickel transport system ATP-binding protein